MDIADFDMDTAATALAADLSACALLLDIDGTILDIAPAPREVRVPPPLRDTLGRLRQLTGGALALVSGRSLEDIDLIFAPLELAAIGGHGAELRPAAGTKSQARAGLLSADLKHKLAKLTELGPGILVEDKNYSLALHYRRALRLGPALQAAVTRICAELPSSNLEIMPGKAVIEVKPAWVNKASAVRELMTYPPFAGRHPIFVGDDVTDEPVFGIIPDFDGLGFSVGRAMPGADGQFRRPEDVRSWLARIAANGGDAAE